MNVDKVQSKMCRRLQGTVGFVGAFWHREESNPGTTELLHRPHSSLVNQ